MDEKFFVDYEALVYNMPACKGFEFLDHVFVVNNVTTEIEKIIKPDKEPLTMNFAFLNCVVNDEKGNNVFITVKNKITLEVLSDAESDEKLHKQIVDIVRRKMEAVEQHLIFITNLHIFFPTVQISVCSENETKKQSYGYTNNRPMLFRKWTGIAEGIDIGRRLEMNINKDVFDTFRQDKKHKRYNRAFEYYIRSFYEFNHSSAFCMLCASIDAITGNNVVGLTKKRFAKYSSILFCTPLETDELNNKMGKFYKLRSKFVHGGGSKISTEDEILLREYVRKFLMAYFLFWINMEVKNEKEMLQKLDEIYDNHGLYLEYAASAYSFIQLMNEHEKQKNGIINIPMTQKYAIAISKLLEALSSSDTSSLKMERVEENEKLN